MVEELVDLGTKVYAVGDVHGDWSRLNTLINKLGPAIFLVCGDFGYWPFLETIRPVLYGQRQKPWKLKGVKCGEGSHVFWCDGNHEDHWYLRDNPRLINYGNVHYQRRGSIIMLPDGRTVMFMGGADSIDKDFRILGRDWFPEELISQRDLDFALSYPGKIDIIVSHTCPEVFRVLNNKGSDGKQKDPCRFALNQILEKFRPTQWFFGHWHKYQKGVHEGCFWECLDYLGHKGKCWTKV